MTPNPPPPPGAQPPLPPPPGPPVAKPTSRLAIAALVASIVGLCIPCLGPLTAVILAIMALTTMGKRGLGGQGLAIAALVVALAGGVVASLAAIAIPNFIKFQSRSKQVECKSNLKALYTAERSFMVEKDRYSENVAELGFSPQRPLRYSYFLSAQGPYAGKGANPSMDSETHGYLDDQGKVTEPPDIGDMEIGVLGDCPECDFTASCAGNIDTDDTLDVWVISSTDLQLQNGETVPAGVPHQVTNDVTE